MMDKEKLLLKWREERAQRLVTRIQRRLSSYPAASGNQKDLCAAFTAKILGLDKALPAKAEQRITVAVPTAQAPINRPKPKIRYNKPPLIVPKETKSSLQRKKLANPFNLTINYTKVEPSEPVKPTKMKKKPQKNKVTFADPIPSTPHQQRVSLPIMVTPMTTNLVRGLDEWLRKRGRPLECLRLKFFGGPNIHNNNKITPLLEEEENDKSSSKDDAASDVPENKCENVAEEEILEDTTKVNTADIRGALQELHNIITLGYPIKDGIRWLKAMAYRCREITTEPLYWDCKALLNENDKENVPQSEIISQQVSTLNKKLEDLNLNPNWNDVSPKEGLDPKNILNSQGIEFELNQRAYRDGVMSPNVYITPVRRSRRTPQKTPRSSCVRSFNDIDEDARSKLIFKINPALANS